MMQYVLNEDHPTQNLNDVGQQQALVLIMANSNVAA